MKHKVAIQLYTVRDHCSQDLFGTLRAMKAIGYSAVQFAGFYNHEPAAIKEVLDQLQLKTAGLHIGYSAMFQETASLVAAAKILETRDLVLSSMPKDFQNEAGYRRVKSELQVLAEQLKPEEIRISYHNHAYELETWVDQEKALTYLLSPAGSPDLHAEIDVFWVKKAGVDLLPYLKAYNNRMPIIHLKDMSHDQQRYDVALGTGCIDFAPILRWGEQSGVEWYVIEQDNCRTDAIESVKLSYDNLLKVIHELEAKGGQHE